ncbi:MAG: 5-formyltetrahydrofolate cyclo-ligase [Candidatus Egerieousia sp.]|nr:5-formyltetrahydrofolate cyclo-ligase [Candidatus Egerieousia sp.]
MTKSEIRSFVKGLVRGISVEERARFSEALKEEVVGLECWRSAKEVMLFFSLPDEVDMLPLIRAALEEQKRIYLPRVIAAQVSRGVDVCEVAEGNTLAMRGTLAKKSEQAMGSTLPKKSEQAMGNTLPKKSTLPAGNTVSGEEMILEVRELAPGLMPGGLMPGQLRPGQLAQMLPPEQLAQMLPPGQLAPGRWGIWEPTDEAPLLSDYSRLDLVVVPGVAFSSDGKRLGRGKSFYDRFLPLVPRAAFVGVCYPCQVVEQIPADPWDIGMDIVCCGKKR